MLGEHELVRLIEANDFPARLIATGVTWVEIEVADPKTRAVRRERMSKSMFADLILDWRSRRVQSRAKLRHALREIDIAA